MIETTHAASSPPHPESADPSKLLILLAAEKDARLRLAADFENYIKRTRRDSEARATVEKDSFIHELLPILDNLERALACEHSNASPQLHQGVAMTVQLLARLLQSHGIEAVEDAGQSFDPHQHEAVSVRHDSQMPDHSVVEVVQRGYRRGDKVFRPSKVIVNDLGQPRGVSRGG